MLGGIVFQLGELPSALQLPSLSSQILLVVLVLFMLLAAEFFIRSATDRPIPSKLRNDSTATLYHTPMWTQRLIIMSAALGFMALVLLIRSVVLSL